MRNFWALPALLRVVLAGHHAFSVNDDVLAFPQYEIKFSHDHVSESLAHSRMLEGAGSARDGPIDNSELSSLVLRQQNFNDYDTHSEKEQFRYDILKLKDQRHLCRIPLIDRSTHDANDTLSQQDEDKELARANDRGWELLSEMKDNCIYFWGGWWSYQYCFGQGVKQFHQLPARQGIPAYPPVEDPSITGFVLGSIESETSDKQEEDDAQTTDVAERKSDVAMTKARGRLETRGETRYLVQRLGGGTVCDLTGKPRRIEVQFHCNPASQDRISLIKEIATCAYLMVIQTPRLCNDVAFLPPQKDNPNTISCSPILSQDEVPAYSSHVAASAKQALASHVPNPLGSQSEVPPSVGNIVVGAHKWIEKGKPLDKSAIVGGKLKSEVIADSTGMLATAEQLRKLGVKDPKYVEKLLEQLKEQAGGKEWTLEVVETPKGKEYRAIIDTAEGEETTGKTERKAEKKVEKKGGKAASDDSEGKRRTSFEDLGLCA